MAGNTSETKKGGKVRLPVPADPDVTSFKMAGPDMMSSKMAAPDMTS